MEGAPSGLPLTPGELWDWLAETPAKIGMTRILSPQVEAVPTGLCGYVLLAESHISAHLGYRIRHLLVACRLATEGRCVE